MALYTVIYLALNVQLIRVIWLFAFKRLEDLNPDNIYTLYIIFFCVSKYVYENSR